MGWLSRMLGRSEETPGWIEAEALSRQLQERAGPLVVDVRGSDEFDGPLGHIEGAVNVPLPEFAPHVPELARERRRLVLVCMTDRRSAAAAQQLRAAGAADVAVLRGGMQRWRELGLP